MSIRALRMPFGRWRLSLLLLGLVGLPYLLLTIGVQVLTGLMLGTFYADDFFAPSRWLDPLLVQHVVWLFGHPEILALAVGVPMLLFWCWSAAIWFQQGRLLPGWRHVGRIFIIFCTALLLEALLAGALSAIGAGFDWSLVSWPVALFFMVRLTPAIVSAEAELWPRWVYAWRQTSGQSATLIGVAAWLELIYALLWLVVSLMADGLARLAVLMPVQSMVILRAGIAPALEWLLSFYISLVGFALVEQVARLDERI